MSKSNKIKYENVKRLSSSALSLLSKYSPIKCFNLIENGYKNNKEVPDIGKPLHCKILEPHLFEEEYIYLEFEKPKNPKQRKFCEDYINSSKSKKEEKAIEAYKKNYSVKTDKNIKTKALKLTDSLNDYIKHLNLSKSNKTILSKSLYDKILECEGNIKLHKLANKLLFNPENYNSLNKDLKLKNELEIYWDFKLDNSKVECKSKIDRLIIDHKNKIIKLVDLKSTSSLYNFSESFDKYNYGIQLCFYWMSIMYYFKTSVFKNDKDWYNKFNEYKKETYIVAICTISFECKVFKIKDSKLDEYTPEINSLIRRYIWHRDNKSWNYSMEYYTGDGSEQL